MDTRNVLLADDEWHLRLMFATMLKQAGYAVAGEAANGADAVMLYDSLQPDLLLMDINMPIMTGGEALREIIAKHPEARIIMLTSVSDMETVEKCLDDGAINYIRKDCPLDEIRSIVDEVFTEDTDG